MQTSDSTCTLCLEEGEFYNSHPNYCKRCYRMMQYKGWTIDQMKQYYNPEPLEEGLSEKELGMPEISSFDILMSCKKAGLRK